MRDRHADREAGKDPKLGADTPSGSVGPGGSALEGALSGVHRYPRARSGYIVVTREFLRDDCGMRLRERLESFADPIERRDWLARERGIKGLGYKEASHFLRNVGFRGRAGTRHFGSRRAAS